MVTLHVVLDPILEGHPRGVARYAEELTRSLIETAPADCDVVGVVSASSETEYATLHDRLPGLAGLRKSALARRELYRAWRHGATSASVPGMVHSPSLLAPLRRHERGKSGRQTVVTIHDAKPWLLPAEGDPRAAWARGMARRAHRHADAIVVPTHAVADDLSAFLDFGERIRVIPGAARPATDWQDRIHAGDLGLPAEYLLTLGSPAPHERLGDLLAALALPQSPDIPVVVVGQRREGGRSFDALLEQSGLPSSRAIHLGLLPDDELAAAYAGATAFVLPTESEGAGLPVIEAFASGVPVITSDAAALVEVADGASVLVPRLPGPGYAERLAAAISSTLADSSLLDRLAVAGRDRARAFSWQDSAERTWQLHADL